MEEQEEERPLESQPGASEFVELPASRKDDESDLGIAEDGELKGLLQQAAPTLGKGHLPARRVLYPPYLRLPSHHVDLRALITEQDSDQSAARRSARTDWRKEARNRGYQIGDREKKNGGGRLPATR